MKTYSITPTAIIGRTSKAGGIAIPQWVYLAIILAIYATVDGLADVFFGGAL